MTYRVELAVRVEDALAELPGEGRQEVMETIAQALVRRDAWPEPGGWEAALWFGPRTWVAFIASLDGIDIVNMGWAG